MTGADRVVAAVGDRDRLRPGGRGRAGRDLLGAVSYGAVCAAVDQLAGRNVQVVSLPPRRLDDIWDNIRTVAAALGRAATGEALLAGLRARLDRVQRRTAGPPRPRVVSVEWLDPVMLGGTWMPELITTAGGDPLGVEAGAQAPTLDMADLKTLEPEVVVIKPCGYPVEHTLAELDLLPEVLPWDDWPAVRTGRVYVADATPTSTAAAPGSSTRPSSWPAACTPTASRDHRTRYQQAVRRIDADLEVHTWGG